MGFLPWQYKGWNAKKIALYGISQDFLVFFSVVNVIMGLVIIGCFQEFPFCPDLSKYLVKKNLRNYTICLKTHNNIQYPNYFL